jgi:site-specific DNA-methyltransferase (adenine-specific)
MKVDIFNTDKKYNIIYADPPWRYSDKGCSGAAQKHYGTMAPAELAELPIGGLAADNCVLLMWATYPQMQTALDLIKAWALHTKRLPFNG